MPVRAVDVRCAHDHERNQDADFHDDHKGVEARRMRDASDQYGGKKSQRSEADGQRAAARWPGRQCWRILISDFQADGEKFTVTESGIVVISKGMKLEA